ncbi:MAG TPA: asparagine synthase-related protein, partial [Ilumatobacteraceae bacterium]|nr:asparagine synthase-related protein [Ilumatobacteraceae bacterium]
YARIAARHFGVDHREYYVTPADLLDGIPRVLTCRVRSETVEIRRPGSRGRLRWVQMRDVAVTWEQLEMW